MRKIISITIIVALLSGGLYSSEEQEAKKSKSEKTAITASLIATVFPIFGAWVAPSPVTGTLVAYGLIAGPSTGHFYARQWMRGLVTTGVRVASGVLGFASSYGPAWSGEYSSTEVVLITLSIIGFVGSAIYDIATAGSSVRKYNESIKKSNVYLVPKIDKESYGVSLVYCF